MDFRSIPKAPATDLAEVEPLGEGVWLLTKDDGSICIWEEAEEFARAVRALFRARDGERGEG